VWGSREESTGNGRHRVCRCPKGRECPSPAKHPITVDGFKAATTDPERIKTFLAAASVPNYGVVPPDGVFVLDVDGPDVARFERLADDYGALPDTFTVSTANGKHAYYNWPEGVDRPEHKMFGLITRWGTGSTAGYVIGPGSVHASGHVYATDGLPFVEPLPARWVAAATVKPVTFTIPGGDDELPTEGGRHDWLRDRARYHAGHIRDAAVLEATMLAENGRLENPKTPEQVRDAIGNVLDKFGADPEARYVDAANYKDGRLTDVLNGHEVVLDMPYVTDGRSGPSGELTVTVDDEQRQRSNEPLLDAVRADRVAAALEKICPIGIHWPSILAGFYRRRHDDHKFREPLEPIGHDAIRPEPSYVVKPLVLGDVATILFAKEGTGKSTLAAAIALSAASGVPVFTGWEVAEPTPVLVLDWETSRADWNDHVARMAAGCDIPVPRNIFYEPMARAITKDLRETEQLVKSHDAGLVVVDSVMMASPPGSGEAADSALELFRGLRELGVTSLLIDHLNKQTPSGEGARPYGSVYKPALARATFELYERDTPAGVEPNPFVQHLTVSQRKANLTAKHPDAHFRVERVGGSLKLLPDSPHLTKDKQYQDIAGVLASHGALSLDSVCSHARIKKSLAEDVLEHWPEFAFREGEWSYEPA